jgi:hypothetical protein
MSSIAVDSASRKFAPVTCTFTCGAKGFEPRTEPVEMGFDLHFLSPRVVTQVLRVLRICLGVLRDVTVLGQPIPHAAVADLLVFGG